MAVLRLQVPHTTRTSQLQVENQLKVGRHLFRLVVVDSLGRTSAPALAEVEVVARRRIVRPIPPIRRPPIPIRNPIPNPRPPGGEDD